MTTQTEITAKNHRRAVRFFWAFLIGATLVSLIGNITHAVLPYIPHVAIQIGTAAVPPIALLAARHGIALAVRAGASGTVYCWAVGAVAAIGVGAFAVSFLALRDLMLAIGYSSTTACIFPMIIDTAVAVSTLMLVALGDKPARRTRAMTTSANTQSSKARRLPQAPRQGAKGEARAPAAGGARVPTSASLQPDPAQAAQESVQALATQADVNLAFEVIASGVTTQPVETVVAVLASHRGGASINAAAKASGINYRTAQRIVEGAAQHRHRQLVAVG
jgi:pyruvate/2-oxoglutarate dehydrogenase complex dihydrolipoamide acyltransferase (E2) component